MKRIAVPVLLLIVAVLPPAFAQTQAPSAGVEAKDAAGTAATEKPAAGPRQRARPTADARHCLQLATIVEITRCAEKYR